MSQKYVIVHFIDISKAPNEYPYTEQPIHITLLANFTITQPLETLTEKLQLYAQVAKPLKVTTEGEELFGKNKDVAVSLIKPSKNILKMHNDLVALSMSLGATYDEPKFMNNGFRPHAAKQLSARLTNKQTLTLNSFTLVDMYPNNDSSNRRIIKTYYFGSE